ncbi:MAG: hypothetical protein M3P86_04795 [Actinomycetota bacterium]|nr:hypothetical protein [Actinomycetota bacterium]
MVDREAGEMRNRAEEVSMRRVVAGLFVSLDGVVEAPEKWQLPVTIQPGSS